MFAPYSLYPSSLLPRVPTTSLPLGQNCVLGESSLELRQNHVFGRGYLDEEGMGGRWGEEARGENEKSSLRQLEKECKLVRTVFGRGCLFDKDCREWSLGRGGGGRGFTLDIYYVLEYVWQEVMRTKLEALVFLFIHYYVIIMVNSFIEDTLQIHLLIYSTLLVSSLIIPFSKLTLIILFP